ncbi:MULTISPECIES: saccharopine dehydrogenase family protein [unclassified Bartonella]|uniref:saccharopine dehydrogenase family protein n=1 Tax=unclassified Bartonella TaxID=2645622 RepID=UPI0015F87DBA|nr:MULTISPECIES: saccharopine dehydrogenase family protein [unclassified Bartonella]UXN03388.1 saccharopine dehydrogenase family protein [Bartonella sp. HY406]UXN06347.1 saccharopine dehydrogenase family protein [Bartonella sp. HY761]
MKKNVLIIGAGGVAQVVAHKCAQNNDILGDLHIASRRIAKCEIIIASVKEKNSMKVDGVFKAHSLDAMNVAATVELIKNNNIEIVINVGSAFLNMSVLSACVEAKVAYIDTAIHEDQLKICETPPWYGNYEWPRREECEKAGVTAILGAGFDPGVVNAYAALARDNYFDTMESIDIIDINAGSHGRWFATNFDPEINFREFTGQVWSWQDNNWTSNEMFEVRKDWDLPVVGTSTTYMTGHDEIHSLSKNLDVPNIRFWMGFGERYITVFNVLKNLGLLSEQPVKTAEGLEVVPLKVVKAVLPDPSSLAPDYTGKTCIGDLVKGKKDGKEREVFIYNVADHREAYDETGAQGISYTAGVPAAAAALLVATGEWDVKTMANIEELAPQPFLALLDKMGLPTRIKEGENDKPLEL